MEETPGGIPPTRWYLRGGETPNFESPVVEKPAEDEDVSGAMSGSGEEEMTSESGDTV